MHHAADQQTVQRCLEQNPMHAHSFYWRWLMICRRTATALAAMAFGSAHAGDGLDINFSGFGTVSAVHSSAKDADFVGNFLQPNGAGTTRRTSLDPDSKLGLQANVGFTDKLSGVVQLVSQHQYDNSYTPQVEWLNVKYQLTPEFSARVGRIALPTFLVSDSRFVGYANTSVRPPLEVYDSMPITSNDGLDFTFRNKLLGGNNTFQAFAGRSTVKLPGGGKAKSARTLGFNNSIDLDSLTLRVGYTSYRAALEVPQIDALIGGLEQFASGIGAVPLAPYQAAAAKASAMAQTYKPSGIVASNLTFGASYDPGDWFVTGEFVANRGKGFFSTVNSWYASGGYRLGSLTPYATYAAVKTTTRNEPGISTAGLDPQSAAAAADLNFGVKAVIGGFAPTQKSFAVGLRWDFAQNMDIKAQYERLSLGGTSSGRLGNVQPTFIPGGKVNVVSVAVDFVF